MADKFRVLAKGIVEFEHVRDRTHSEEATNEYDETNLGYEVPKLVSIDMRSVIGVTPATLSAYGEPSCEATSIFHPGSDISFVVILPYQKVLDLWIAARP